MLSQSAVIEMPSRAAFTLLYVNNPKLFKAKARPSTIKKLQQGIGQLGNLLKNINKN